MERFKNIELANVRLEESKKYLQKIDDLRDEYQKEYDLKYKELKNMKDDLTQRELQLERDYEQKNFENNQKFQEKLKNLNDINIVNDKKYINEINQLNSEKNKLLEDIENLRDKYNKDMLKEIEKIKNDYQNQLQKEINNQILINNYTTAIKNKETAPIKTKINEIINKEPVISNFKTEFKPNNLNKGLSENYQERKKKLDELEEEQYRLNQLMRYEFKNMTQNEETPIVLINEDEINKIKKNEYYNNVILNENKEKERRKSIENNMLNNKSGINMNQIKQRNTNLSSLNQSGLLNSSIRKKSLNYSINNNITQNKGIGGTNLNNYFINNNIDKKKNDEIIDENISNENYNNSKNSKDASTGKKSPYNPYQTNNIGKLPPINKNQLSQSIKEDIEESKSHSKNNYINNVNKSNNKFQNIDYENNNINNLNNENKEETIIDEYGDGDFENISSYDKKSNNESVMKKSKVNNNMSKVNKNYNDPSMSAKIDNVLHSNTKQDENKESSGSYNYNDFETSNALNAKGINQSGMNNVSKYKNSKGYANSPRNGSGEIQEEIVVSDSDSHF